MLNHTFPLLSHSCCLHLYWNRFLKFKHKKNLISQLNDYSYFNRYESLQKKNVVLLCIKDIHKFLVHEKETPLHPPNYTRYSLAKCMFIKLFLLPPPLYPIDISWIWPWFASVWVRQILKISRLQDLKKVVILDGQA